MLYLGILSAGYVEVVNATNQEMTGETFNSLGFYDACNPTQLDYENAKKCIWFDEVLDSRTLITAPAPISIMDQLGIKYDRSDLGSFEYNGAEHTFLYPTYEYKSPKFESGMAYCQALSDLRFAGRSDWRLSTMAHLRALHLSYKDVTKKVSAPYLLENLYYIMGTVSNNAENIKYKTKGLITDFDFEYDHARVKDKDHGVVSCYSNDKYSTSHTPTMTMVSAKRSQLTSEAYESCFNSEYPKHFHIFSDNEGHIPCFRKGEILMPGILWFDFNENFEYALQGASLTIMPNYLDSAVTWYRISPEGRQTIISRNYSYTLDDSDIGNTIAVCSDMHYDSGKYNKCAFIGAGSKYFPYGYWDSEKSSSAVIEDSNIDEIFKYELGTLVANDYYNGRLPLGAAFRVRIASEGYDIEVIDINEKQLTEYWREEWRYPMLIASTVNDSSTFIKIGQLHKDLNSILPIASSYQNVIYSRLPNVSVFIELIIEDQSSEVEYVNHMHQKRFNDLSTYRFNIMNLSSSNNSLSLPNNLPATTTLIAKINCDKDLSELISVYFPTVESGISYRWPATLAKTLNSRSKCVIAGEKKDNGSGEVEVIQSEYRNNVYSRDETTLITIELM